MMYKHIRVKKEDHDKMMDICIRIFLKHHPELRGMRITRNFMFNKLVTFYINTP